MPMWTLKKTFAFEAAHRLPSHAGKCNRMHGHNWTGVLILESAELEKEGPARGMVMDYSSVKEAARSIIEGQLDHYCLNDRAMENPTSEELARWIFDKLKPTLPALAAVGVEETPGSYCEYRP